MKLRYRGQFYESNSQPIETRSTEITAKFRGQTYQVRRLVVGVSYQPRIKLKYRGAAYTVKPAPAIKPQISPKNNGINPTFG